LSTYVSNRDGGKTNEEGHYRFHVKAWTGNVLSGLQAQAKSPLALGVDITTGDVKVDYSGYGYTAWTDALESVTLTTADPSNPRIDRIVGYIDRGVTPSSAVTNNPSILKFMAVAGTPAGSPSAPNDAAVQSAVGASNPWFPIAQVLVGTGVTTISSGNITDTRVLVGATIKDLSVTAAKLATDSVTAVKTDFGGDFTTSEVNTGFTWVDGKTIYKKTINMGSLPNNTQKNVAHGITGITKVLSIEGSYTNGTITFPANRPDTTGTTGVINTFINGADITVVTGVDRTAFSGHVTLTYVK
jgi:hypothetical protein